MRAIFRFLVIAALAWFGYSKYRDSVEQQQLAAMEPVMESVMEPEPAATPPASATFHCDGRTYCSQMSSYAEAKYFLDHCPGVKMDGDNDGVPCERQFGR